MNNKYYFALIFLISLNCIYAENPKNDQDKKPLEQCFIVPASSIKKNASKNDIKEEIGSSLKDSLDSCAELSKVTGEILVEISAIQKRLFDSVENLIDNGKKFKNASRGDLKKSHNTLGKVNSEFSMQLSKLREIKKEIDSDTCLKVS